MEVMVENMVSNGHPFDHKLPKIRLLSGNYASVWTIGRMARDFMGILWEYTRNYPQLSKVAIQKDHILKRVST